MDHVGEFKSQMASFGLVPVDIISDGRIHRFSVGKKRDKNGWYVLFVDPDGAGGAFGNWSEGSSEKWTSFKKSDNDPEKYAQFMASIEESKKRHESERLDSAERARNEAVRLWNDAKVANGIDHSYLVRKNVKGIALRVEAGTGNLIVPMYAPGKTLVSLQRIMPDGSKRFLSGGTVKGTCCYIKGAINDRIYVCEGYATGETVSMATGRTVFIAFNSGNMPLICEQIRRNTKTPIIVCADNDLWSTRADGTPYNAGLVKALECQEKFDCIMFLPKFKDLSTEPTDFNDLHTLEGIDAVRSILHDPFISRYDKVKKTVTDWAVSSSGKFSTLDIDRELGIDTVDDKAARDDAICALIENGTLEQDDVKRNVYRSRDRNVNVMDLTAIKTCEDIEFWMPFGLGEIVALSPRNIVMIAGESNSGKTTIALKTLKQNIAMYQKINKKFFYITSEMGDSELKNNVLRFGKLEDFQECTFIDRQFEPYDLIKGNKEMQDGFVFIDFLETRGGDYSKTVSEVQKIYDAMGKGVAIVLVQKQPGKEWGKGGSGMLEKPRFALNLEKRFKSDSGTVCVAKVSKCKSVWPGVINPDGKALYYIVNEKGTTELTGWGVISDKTKDETDTSLKAQLGVREYMAPVIDMEAIDSVRRRVDNY